MVALPGLCLATGRPWLARNIMRTFARFVSEGMLPNTFPRAGEPPEYNSVDASLWYFEAMREYFHATSDIGLLGELYPVLAGIIDAHVRGTRYNIYTWTPPTACCTRAKPASNSPGWMPRSATT